VAATQPAPSRGKRIVVVSPHLDDGALSLGASMASWARRGAAVELLTALACDPASKAPAGGWDAIVSIQIAAAQDGRLSVGSAAGPTVAVQPPPYPLLADV